MTSCMPLAHYTCQISPVSANRVEYVKVLAGRSSQHLLHGCCTDPSLVVPQYSGHPRHTAVSAVSFSIFKLKVQADEQVCASGCILISSSC